MVGENKALTAKKARFTPYTTSFNKCRICRQVVHQAGSHYCQGELIHYVTSVYISCVCVCVLQRVRMLAFTWCWFV